MKRKAKKLTLRREKIRTIKPEQATGGQQIYTTTGDEACSGPCCGKVTVSYCPGEATA